MSISENEFFGGADYLSISEDFQLKIGHARTFSLSPDTSGLVCNLPDATEFRHVGGPMLFLHNAGATDDLIIQDFADGAIATISPGELLSLHLLDNSTTAGAWASSQSTLVGGPGLMQVDLSNAVDGEGEFVTADFRGEFELSRPVFYKNTETFATTTFSGELFRDTARYLTNSTAASFATTEFSGQLVPFTATSGIVSPDATGSGIGSPGAPWTLKQAQEQTTAPFTFYLRGGEYPDEVDHRFNGAADGHAMFSGSSASNPIIYEQFENEEPKLLGANRLDDVSFVTFKGIKFHTNGGSILTIAKASTGADVRFENCDFHGSATNQQGGPYSGIKILGGSAFRFYQCSFGDWDHGDFVKFEEVEDITIDDCDMTQARGGHSILHLRGTTKAVIRRCSFRNPWDRVIQITERGGSGNNLVEDNIFFDCDWDGVKAHPYTGTALESDRGSTGVVRISSPRTIVRNNLIVGANKGKGEEHGGAIQMAFYDASTPFIKADNCRFYHNTIHAPYYNCFSVFRNDAVAGDVEAEGVRFLNNSFSDAGGFAFFHRDADISMSSWTFKKNRLSDTDREEVIHLDGGTPEEQRTVAEQEAQSASWTDNITDDPVFRYAQRAQEIAVSPEAFSHADFYEIFQDFFEVAGSPLLGDGASMTATLNDGLHQTYADLPEGDGYFFWGGNTHTEADTILIGGNAATTITEVVDTGDDAGKKITFASVAGFAIDAPICLERQKVNVNIGIYPVTVGLSIRLSNGDAVFATTEHTGSLSSTLCHLSGSIEATSSTTGDLVKSDDLFKITHDGGESVDQIYDDFFGNENQSEISAEAGMGGTSNGLKFTTFGGGRRREKFFDWDPITPDSPSVANLTNDHLRLGFWFDPNSIEMATGDEFYMIQLSTHPNANRKFALLLRWTGGGYRLKFQVREDDEGFRSTLYSSITDAPHFIELRIKVSSSDSAADGEISFFVDGVEGASRGGCQFYTARLPGEMWVGPSIGVDPGTEGEIYYDEITMRLNDQQIYEE